MRKEIKQFNLRSLDLNLLMVLEVVLEERNISRAAVRLGRTQSTISNALTRLRHTLRDDLFIKSGKGVAPTDFALRIAPHVINALDTLRHGFEVGIKNEMLNNTKSFIIATNDYFEGLYLPKILQSLKITRPNLKLKIVDINQSKMQEELAEGVYDLAIDTRLPMNSNLNHEVLQEDEVVLVLADRHPILDKDSFTTADFLALDFVLHRPKSRELQYPEVILRSKNIYRQSSMEVMTITSMLQFVRQAGYAATLPRRLVEDKIFGQGVRYRPLPFDFPKTRIVQIWHTKQGNDQDKIWLRSAVKNAIEQI